MADSQPKEEVFTCSHCGNKTTHKLICRYTQKVPLGIYDDKYGEIEAEYYIYLFECSTCKSMTLKDLFSEEIDDPRDLSWEGVRTLYPSQKEFPDSMPKLLVRVYLEAVRIKKISPLAFCILVRKALEVLCQEEKAEGRNLNEKIKFLAKKNNLPATFIEMINSIRLFGNKGAHEASAEFTLEQVDILDYFFNVIIEYIYIAPEKMKLLKENLERKS